MRSRASGSWLPSPVGELAIAPSLPRETGRSVHVIERPFFLFMWGGPAGSVTSEAALLRRYTQTRDPQLKEELVRRFMPLARSLARRYRGSPEPLEDLIQVASLGLVKALEGFDPQRGESFNAYAAPTILGELRRHFRDRVWDLRLPRELQERTVIVRETAVAI